MESKTNSDKNYFDKIYSKLPDAKTKDELLKRAAEIKADIESKNYDKEKINETANMIINNYFIPKQSNVIKITKAFYELYSLVKNDTHNPHKEFGKEMLMMFQKHYLSTVQDEYTVEKPPKGSRINERMRVDSISSDEEKNENPDSKEVKRAKEYLGINQDKEDRMKKAIDMSVTRFLLNKIVTNYFLKLDSQEKNAPIPEEDKTLIEGVRAILKQIDDESNIDCSEKISQEDIDKFKEIIERADIDTDFSVIVKK